MTNYNHGAFDHWYNSDRLAESRSRLASDISTGDRVRRASRSSSRKGKKCPIESTRGIYQKLTCQLQKHCA